MERLLNAMSAIRALNTDAMKEAADYSDRLTKPQGSLGKLEEIAIQLAGIKGFFPIAGLKKAVVVMAGDHGVCEEGVSAYPQEVTPQMVLNFLQGDAAVNVLARHAGADVVCVDMGMRADLQHDRLIVRKVNRGTQNIAGGPAMSREEAVHAIEAGIEVVDEIVAQGYGIFATGEIGIGNTTPSAAMLAVLGDVSVQSAVGRGTGVDDAGLLKKRAVVERAITVNRADATDALDVLSKLGGFEIAGLVGVIVGAAANRCPVVIDGFISSVAALTAYQLVPMTKEYMIASHLSEETGHRKVLDLLGLTPMLHMNMRLGEGTGAALGLTMVDAAVKVMQEMATFESAGVSRK